MNQPRCDLRTTLMLALAFCSAGCSTAPMCDFLDYAVPGRVEKGKVAPHGGVCAPGQGTIPIVPPPITNLPSTPPVTVPTIPGPAPSPSPFTPATPTIPPPPPPPPQR